MEHLECMLNHCEGIYEGPPFSLLGASPPLSPSWAAPCAMIVQWMERAASRRAANAAEARSVSAHENRRWYGTWLFTIIFLIRTHYFGVLISPFLECPVNFVKSESNWGFTSQPCLIARGQIGMRDQKLAGSIRNMQYMKKHVKLRVSFSKKRDSILVPKSMCTPNYWNNQFYNTLSWPFCCWAA